MRREYIFAILLAIAAFPAGAALMVAPEYLHLSGFALPATFWGGISITIFLLGIATVMAWRGRYGMPTDLKILFKAEPPYETTEITNGRGLSTVRIGLKASGKTFANCHVYIEKIAPNPSLPGGMPIQLTGNVPMFRPDDPESLIEIAAHWDHVDKYRFSAPLPWFDVHLTYIKDEPPRLIEIKITARTDTGEFIKTATFKIWVDETKKLHLQRQ
jgi:hypothetical protein